MCSEKQSIRRVFAKSERAADIRGVVQSHNMKNGEQREAAAEEALQQSPGEADRQDDTVRIVPKEQSAWGAFVANAAASDDDDESDDAGELTSTMQWEDAAQAQRESRKVPSRKLFRLNAALLMLAVVSAQRRRQERRAAHGGVQSNRIASDVGPQPARRDRGRRQRVSGGATHDEPGNDRHRSFERPGLARSAADSRPRVAAAAAISGAGNRAIEAVRKATGVSLNPHTWGRTAEPIIQRGVPPAEQAANDDVATGAEDYDAIFATIPEEVFNGSGSTSDVTAVARVSAVQAHDLWGSDGPEELGSTADVTAPHAPDNSQLHSKGEAAFHLASTWEQTHEHEQEKQQQQQPRQPPLCTTSTAPVPQTGSTRWGQFVTSRRRKHSEASAVTSSSSEEEDEQTEQQAIADALAARSASSQHERNNSAASELFG